jgi:hypothetical protein
MVKQADGSIYQPHTTSEQYNEKYKRSRRRIYDSW